MTPYDIDLDRNPANFQPLTPLPFLERAAAVYPRPHRDHPRAAAAQLCASSMRARGGSPRRSRKRGIKRGDTVSVMLANTPAMLEAHYGVPMTQGVLNTLNTRLDAAIIAFSLDHAETKVLITDREFSKAREGGAGARQGEAAGDRLRRSGIFRRGRAARRARIRGVRRSGRSGLRLEDAGRRMGRDRAQLHVGHHRRSEGRGLSPSRRAICSRSATSSPAAWASIRCISGRCRCSIATAGASRGRSRSSPARMCACARCARGRCTTRSPSHKVTHLCGAPIVMATLLNAPEPRRRSRCRMWWSSSPPPRRRRRPCSPR